MHNDIIKYEISSDKQGLMAHLKGGNNYHIHSDELTPLEKWVLELLKTPTSKCPWCKEEIDNLYDLYTQYYEECFKTKCPHCNKILWVNVKVQDPLFELTKNRIMKEQEATFNTLCNGCGEEDMSVYGGRECKHCGEEFCYHCIEDHEKYCHENKEA